MRFWVVICVRIWIVIFWIMTQCDLQIGNKHVGENKASALTWNYISKCHRISWEGLDVGSTAGDSLLPRYVTSIFVFSFAIKFIYNT